MVKLQKQWWRINKMSRKEYKLIAKALNTGFIKSALSSRDKMTKQKFKYPLVKHITPELSSTNLVSVQPLSKQKMQTQKEWNMIYIKKEDK